MIKVELKRPSQGSPAGNDPEQDHHDGDNEENMDEAAYRGAGHQTQQPQNDQHERKSV
jgi:hypothetical protein